MRMANKQAVRIKTLSIKGWWFDWFESYHDCVRMNRNNVLKGKKLNRSLCHIQNIMKANLECSIIYKMAVILYTNTRPQDRENEDRSWLRWKPRERCLGFSRQKVKNASNQGINVAFLNDVLQWNDGDYRRRVVISMSLFAWLVIESLHPLTSNPDHMSSYRGKCI